MTLHCCGLARWISDVSINKLSDQFMAQNILFPKIAFDRHHITTNTHVRHTWNEQTLFTTSGFKWFFLLLLMKMVFKRFLLILYRWLEAIIYMITSEALKYKSMPVKDQNYIPRVVISVGILQVFFQRNGLKLCCLKDYVVCPYAWWRCEHEMRPRQMRHS